jgi:DNA primase
MEEYNTEYISREILSRLGYRNLKSGRQVMIKCPSEFHNDKSPSCSVSLEKGVFHCFSCGFSGNLKNLYYKKFGHSIYKDLGIQFSMPLQKQETYLPSFDDRPETDFKLTGTFYNPDETDSSREWIKNRGFDVELLKLLRVQFMKYGKSVRDTEPENKDYWMTYKDCMIIPIFENKVLISFEARTTLSKEKWEQKLIKNKLDPSKYTYKKVLYPKFSSVNTLYKLSELKKDKKLYVVEGLMDVISLRSHPHFQNSTCTFGATITERQFYLLNQFDDICIIPNNDAAGFNSLKKFQERKFKNLTVLTLPNTLKDVNDILQRKDSRWSSLDDLLNNDWIKTKEKNIYIFDIENHYRSLNNE